MSDGSSRPVRVRASTAATPAAADGSQEMPCPDHNSPQPRVVELPPCGRIVAIPQVGGLYHRYQQVA
jgi:hypothetical protein